MFREGNGVNQKPVMPQSPGDFEIGSPESRAAARALLNARTAEGPCVALFGQHIDGEQVIVRVYEGGRMTESDSNGTRHLKSMP